MQGGLGGTLATFEADAEGPVKDGGLGAESAEYFLAGRGLGWPVIGLALFATNISTVHVIGLAGSGFAVGPA